jgi:hypothetical protein
MDRGVTIRFVPLVSGPPTSLQSTVDRFAQSLRVADSLHRLHPGTSDMPSRALRPAMVLCAIAAFEGFIDDMLSAALQKQGHTLFQISEQLKLMNPDLEDTERKIRGLFNGAMGKHDDSFGLEVWLPPVGTSGWWRTDVLTWKDAKREATAWMQVRHCLTHGIASGWGSEQWPDAHPPRRYGDPVPAAWSVLRETEPGRYSLAVRCAVNCCRIYRYGAQYLADGLAGHFGELIGWTSVPDFALE